jgi:hypothetical protein
MADSDFDQAGQLLQQAGIDLPPIPECLRPNFRERGPWTYSSRRISASPFAFGCYVEEARNGLVTDYVLVAHDGRGINLYAMHYFLVSRPLQLLLQVAWGGLCMNPEKTTASVNRCFTLARELLDAVPVAIRAGRITEADRLTVVASDFHGGFWEVVSADEDRRVPPLAWREVRRERCNPPAVLEEALEWCLETDGQLG